MTNQEESSTMQIEDILIEEIHGIERYFWFERLPILLLILVFPFSKLLLSMGLSCCSKPQTSIVLGCHAAQTSVDLYCLDMTLTNYAMIDPIS
ncbi:Uncharacterized protein TCM_006614 [Theobroma cacao]|uniref:Uncharacterized protein n=1 Tax=Theobroma cacao TaxID=3641 RepID=A0A061DY73_THECC|nr:Uncharacterized protein TCM_006614 [Theobroma cacao]